MHGGCHRPARGACRGQARLWALHLLPGMCGRSYPRDRSLRQMRRRRSQSCLRAVRTGAYHRRRDAARASHRDRGVPRGRHRDERPGRRRVRDDRGRRGAGRRRRAARSVVARSCAATGRSAAASSASPESRRRCWTARPAWRRCCRRSQRLLEDRVLVAHNAAVRPPGAAPGASQRIGLEWPNPPVLCTAALARKLLPLQRRARPGRARRRAGHRGRHARTGRWPTPRRARASCARCSRGCAPTRLTIADAVALLAPAAPAAAPASRSARAAGR